MAIQLGQKREDEPRLGPSSNLLADHLQVNCPAKLICAYRNLFTELQFAFAKFLGGWVFKLLGNGNRSFANMLVRKHIVDRVVTHFPRAIRQLALRQSIVGMSFNT